ncbi:8-amino-7-oxononanoate synthase [Actinidia chinensis var. chinensis]|uniref:8-amino-7-oxononanoate synthase n=1 Tax=Actinidia chinensis var. chinensis TaxID=1590841 RepID=A0A2R6PLX0_ACTCC|nr:8-amino-7-oxononanoate synthase [Actinidia chinensis var. chinensis]
MGQGVCGGRNCREHVSEVGPRRPSSGDDADCGNQEVDNGARACSNQKFKKLLLFSGNDYLSLSSHTTVSKAASKAALTHGMGPRGSALICGYINYHRLLESFLADLKNKEDCLLCPTGFSANMAVMTTLGNVVSLLAAGIKPLKDERVAIFSNVLNHASIIDGIHLADRQGSAEVFVYSHCDMSHLNALLSNCTMKKNVVVTDSMDGDYVPMCELAKLKKRYGFLVFIVAKKETWRRRAIWNLVQGFHALTGIPVTSPIISLVVGSEEKALQARWYLLKSGFHVTAIRPPTVP